MVLRLDVATRRVSGEWMHSKFTAVSKLQPLRHQDTTTNLKQASLQKYTVLVLAEGGDTDKLDCPTTELPSAATIIILLA